MSFFNREDWKARRPKRVNALPTQPATHVFVHHSVTRNPKSDADQKRVMREMQAYHMDVKGWNDIAYSHAIFKGPGDTDGAANRAEGRGWGVWSGGTGSPYDTYSYSMVGVGNFMDMKANNKLIDAFIRQITNGIERGHIIETPTIMGDRDVNATACPGDNLYARIPDIRRGVREWVCRNI